MTDRSSGCGCLILLVIAGLAVAHCTSRPSYDDYGSEVASEVPARGDVAADAAADLGASTYEAEGAPYGCTEDCEGHEAGWQWAAENEISDAGDCYGNNASFDEGCQAFAEAVESRTENQIAEYE